MKAETVNIRCLNTIKTDGMSKDVMMYESEARFKAIFDNNKE